MDLFLVIILYQIFTFKPTKPIRCSVELRHWGREISMAWRPYLSEKHVFCEVTLEVLPISFPTSFPLLLSKNSTVHMVKVALHFCFAVKPIDVLKVGFLVKWQQNWTQGDSWLTRQSVKKRLGNLLFSHSPLCAPRWCYREQESGPDVGGLVSLSRPAAAQQRSASANQLPVRQFRSLIFPARRVARALTHVCSTRDPTTRPLTHIYKERMTSAFLSSHSCTSFGSVACLRKSRWAHAGHPQHPWTAGGRMPTGVARQEAGAGAPGRWLWFSRCRTCWWCRAWCSLCTFTGASTGTSNWTRRRRWVSTFESTVSQLMT